MVNFSTLRWEIILDYPGESSVITGILIRVSQISRCGVGSRGRRAKFEEVMLLALWMEEGARSQGIWASES